MIAHLLRLGKQAISFPSVSMAARRVPLDAFAEEFSAFTELSSVALGGRVVSVSDDFFAEAFHLLLVEPAPSLKGQFGPNGALFSGWESRRHNPAYDWCIIQLGTSGSISGFDIDTSHFNGNEAPEVSVDVLAGAASEEPGQEDSRWVEVLPKQALGPNSRHLFRIPETTGVNFVKLNMYPDGGIARFRVYGQIIPVHPKDPAEVFDLAHVFAGGRVEFTSDQHFGVGSNLILPGRGKDMGDGWETKRSREKGHKDWAIIRLGAPGALEYAEIDTAHFKGNFPESCELHALVNSGDADWTREDHEWTAILPRTKLGPHRQHYFQLENVKGQRYTHVKVTIHPDGGIKRVRIFGTKGEGGASVSSTNAILVPVLPLTPEAFTPFGQVIQAYADHNAAPKGIKITPANQGSATKFHKLSLLASSYPAEAGATAGISVYRCNPLEGISSEGGSGEGLTDPGCTYLVVVAKNGDDGRPDVKTVKAFVANASQGVMYNTAAWHQPMTVLGKAMDFACVETQVGDGRLADCEIVELESALILRDHARVCHYWRDFVTPFEPITITISPPTWSPKKRPHAQEADVSVAKKRILSGANGAPYVNGSAHEHEEPADMDNLEMFRKEAIFRRMRHYSREYDRSQSRIAELEQRKNTCEAGLAAMAACWSQLVEAIRLVAKPEDLPETTPNTREIFDISSHISDDDAPDLFSALEDNMQATQHLVTKFVSLGSGSQLPGGDAYIRCQKAQTECVALRSEIQVINSKLRNSEAQKYELHEQLVAAEIAADRLRSKTVQAIKPRSETLSVQSPTEEQRKPSSPVPPRPSTPVINGHNGLIELEERKFLADLREKQVEELRKEVADLTARNNLLTLNSKATPTEVVTESPHYKVLMDHASYLSHALSETQQENTRLSDELQAALDSRREWQESIETAANESNKELKTLIGKRDAENTRLREQRDQQAAELNERKQRDNVKLASMKELESLAEARSAKSQLGRHKAQLAASAGNEDLMRFFFSGELDDLGYIEELRNRVILAEQRAAAVNQTLSIFQDDHPNVVQHMEAEANALQKLAAATAELESYQKTYGELSSLNPDVAQLAEKVKVQEEEIKRLRLKDEQHVKEKTSVYSELDQLSAAWEALDRQVKSKVFELKDMEDRVSKIGLDKAKSDNKFFAAMRDKEAIENERKILSRNQEKQFSTIERLQETERNLSQQVMSLDKDLGQMRRQFEARTMEVYLSKKELREQRLLQEADGSALTVYKDKVSAMEKDLTDKKAELQKLSEELALSKRQIEKQVVQLQEKVTGSSSSREAGLEEQLKATMNVLKCGACKGPGFRDTVITKCGHTFCKACVDARISTRQRKCPACNLPFGLAEVLTIYLQ
ncbi:putative allantoicase [Mycena sanguinolenta]|uniref:Putative allantoicase n=1 Tax=Mycena sanguinolenta TaxID=230812 RepID=A0A8H7DM85_9AGAR|nr:putative allantoicase [Mycena sanguinolenta]